jgi:hypothetical protein
LSAFPAREGGEIRRSFSTPDEAVDKRGFERIEISVTNETKKVMGVTTTVVRAREWKNGVLWEDT